MQHKLFPVSGGISVRAEGRCQGYAKKWRLGILCIQSELRDEFKLNICLYLYQHSKVLKLDWKLNIDVTEILSIMNHIYNHSLYTY